MATITTDTFLDDGTARTAGETRTMNGGVLTIRTDTRAHANAPASMTGTLGVITISSTAGGGVLLDGRDVRWMPYDTGTGTVPAIGTIITQGGVEGYLLGVRADYVSAPVVVGGAMPTTGFLKFREVTGGSFVAGALAGIGASATSPDVTGWIEVVQRQSVANTISRLGLYRTRGNWFELGNTNGVTGQIVQIPTNGGGADTSVPCVWIETGVGTGEFEAYPAIGATWFTTTNLGTDDRSKFVLIGSNGTVRIGGNGTDAIGFLPPSGCRIRIPNVIGRQSIAESDNLNQFPSATLGTRPDFSTNAAGVIDFEYFLNDWYHAFVNPYSVRVVNSATFDVHYSTNEATPCYLENFHTGGTFNNSSTATTAFAQLNNSNGGIVKNCKFYRVGTGANRPAWVFQGCRNYDFQGIVEGGVIDYDRLISQLLNFNLSDNNTVSGILKVVGCGITMTQSSFNTFNLLRYIDRFTGETVTAAPYNMIRNLNKSNNNRFNAVDFGGYNCHPYGALLSTQDSSNVTLLNVGTFSNPIGGATNPPSYIFADSGNCSNIKVSDIYLTATRANLIATIASSKNMVFQKLFGTVGNLNNLSTNVTMRGLRGNTHNLTTQAAVYGYHFSDIFLNDTEGLVRLAFNEPTTETATQFEVVVGGTGFGFTAAGSLAMPTLGQQVIWTMPGFVKGHTGFRNVAVGLTGVGTGNFTFEYDIDTGSGFTGTYKTLNVANLMTETVNATTGFRLKYRITCIASSSTNALSFVTVFTESTALAQQNIDYPLEFYDVNLNGILANTRLQIYDVTNSEEIYNSVITSAGSFSRSFEYTGDFVARFRLMLMTGDNAYQFIEFNENITTNGLTRTIEYTLDTVYNNNGIDGTAVTNISIDDDALLINVNTGEISRQEIYAYETYWLYTEEGIRDEGRFIVAIDEANYVFENFKIKNISSPSLPLVITGGRGRDEATGETITLIDITGGTIFSNPDLVITSNNNINTLNKIKKNTDLIPALI